MMMIGDHDRDVLILLRLRRLAETGQYDMGIVRSIVRSQDGNEDEVGCDAEEAFRVTCPMEGRWMNFS